jgi:type II secretory pathway component GspD/PulD (secretin)
LIISDIPAYIEKIKNVIKVFDVPPQQILIESRIMEVSENKLKDLGVEWGTGSTGAENAAITSTPTEKTATGNVITAAGGHSLSTQVTPASFVSQASGITPANTGLNFLFQRLQGNQFEVMLHALEEDVSTNTLSAPRIMTLNNQEATILVGTKYPILKSDISTQAGTTVTSTLDYYQDIGIQLNVVPQISGDNKYINMVIHPAVTSFDSSNTVGSNKYPVISTREAETRVLVEDNQTIVIGGLLKDVRKKGNLGVPFLKDLPFIGAAFRRDTNSYEKVDLLIFITARIIKPDSKAIADDMDEFSKSYQVEQDMIRERLQDKDGGVKNKAGSCR